MSLLLPWNAKSEEKTREIFFSNAVGVSFQQNVTKSQALQAQLTLKRAEYEALTKKAVPRWLHRKARDLEASIQKLEVSLQSVVVDKLELRQCAEEKEAKYAELLRKLKTNPKNLVTQSAHSVQPATKRKNAVVVASRENIAELLRQKFRAELGLQDMPLMITAGDVCDDCGLSMLVVSNDSMLTCPQCHKMRVLPNTMSSSAMQDSDPASVITKHRFTEWLEFMQAKDVCTPPEDVLEIVGNYLIENHLTGLEQHAKAIAEERTKNGPFQDILDAERRLPGLGISDACKSLMTKNPTLVRGILKQLVSKGGSDKLRKFYERSVKITALLSGYWPPRLSGSQEEIMRMMFCAAAPFYERERKPRTTTWPGGFPYFLRSLCILLGWDEFAHQFPVSNTSINVARDALRQKIWSLPEMKWECVPYMGELPPIKLPDGTMLHTCLEDLSMDGDEDEIQAAAPKPKAAPKKRARPASIFEFG
jgi:hypothetical protein